MDPRARSRPRRRPPDHSGARAGGGATQQIDQSDLDQAVEIIRRRVDASGVAEAEITTQGNNIVVALPGNPDQATVDLVAQSAQAPVPPRADDRRPEPHDVHVGHPRAQRVRFGLRGAFGFGRCLDVARTRGQRQRDGQRRG
ncbi:hypothetical protein [Demequina litorisediminis]|uniref:hypothetical protein n=1 Tax=Demequina litorisediminis TaxID=1849022 RepID=UPI0024E0CCC3|nr:hypothetical protein [Demequina litorisediminis]